MSTRRDRSHVGGARLRWALLLGVAGALALGGVALAQSGTVYDLHWNVLSGGGALASGATYQINYSFGQPSTVDLSTGASYQLAQGYWHGAGPTPVELAAFSAAAHGRDVQVGWETASEIDLVGFNLYRSTAAGGPYVQVNGKLIPARNPGAPYGAVYTWWDRGLRMGRTYYYQLEAVSSGGTEMYGPVSVTLRPRVGPQGH